MNPTQKQFSLTGGSLKKGIPHQKSLRLLPRCILHMKTVFGILAFTLALLTRVSAQSFLTNGLVAYYPFNGNANDESGNGNPGTPHNATLTSDRFASTNGAYYFNGSSSYIALAHNLDFNSMGDVSFSTWVKPGTGGKVFHQANGGQLFLDASTNSVSLGAHLINYNGSGGSDSWYSAGGSVSFSTDKYVHLCGVFRKGQQMELWTNGVCMNIITIPNLILVSPWWSDYFSANFGTYSDAWTGYSSMFQGSIDEFRIYSRALSSNEIPQLALITCPSIISQPQSLMVWADRPASFSVTGDNTGPFSYQWAFNGGTISGATNASYTIDSVGTDCAGGYSVTLSNTYGSVTSAVATLTMLLPPQGFNGRSTNASQLALQFTGTPGYSYVLQMAADLAPPANWQPVLTNAADTNGNWRFIVTNLVGVPCRFYRIAGQ